MTAENDESWFFSFVLKFFSTILSHKFGEFEELSCKSSIYNGSVSEKLLVNFKGSNVFEFIIS